ncbi:hypothetical protein D3C76_1414130 [compost metagenome]
MQLGVVVLQATIFLFPLRLLLLFLLTLKLQKSELMSYQLVTVRDLLKLLGQPALLFLQRLEVAGHRQYAFASGRAFLLPFVQLPMQLGFLLAPGIQLAFRRSPLLAPLPFPLFSRFAIAFQLGLQGGKRFVALFELLQPQVQLIPLLFQLPLLFFGRLRR